MGREGEEEGGAEAGREEGEGEGRARGLRSRVGGAQGGDGPLLVGEALKRGKGG